MAVTAVLADICELQELKKDTIVTKSVLSTAQSLLLLKDDDKLTHLAYLITKLRSSYTAMLSRLQWCKLTATKMDELWVLFHSFSLQEGYKLCRDCDTALGLKAHDIFWQLLMEKEFLKQVIDTLKSTSPASTASWSRELTRVEENAVRYTAGYIIRKLLNMYSKQKSQEKIGHDMVYYLFVALELITDRELSAIFQSRGKGVEKVKKEKLSWLCDNEEVQFIWSMISPSTIEEESVHQDLLREVAFMWVTTRGHSKAQQLKEEHKKSKAEGTKGRKSLRKELAAPHTERTD